MRIASSLLFLTFSLPAWCQTTITYVPNCTRLPCPTKTVTIPAGKQGPQGVAGKTGPQGIPGTLSGDYTYTLTLTSAQIQQILAAASGASVTLTGVNIVVTVAK